jgi:hypothetical protein
MDDNQSWEAEASPEDLEQAAAQKTAAAAIMLAAAAKFSRAHVETIAAMMRATDRWVRGADEDRARARELRR